jgi:hypothetical protein
MQKTVANGVKRTKTDLCPLRAMTLLTQNGHPTDQYSTPLKSHDSSPADHQDAGLNGYLTWISRLLDISILFVVGLQHASKWSFFPPDCKGTN